MTKWRFQRKHAHIFLFFLTVFSKTRTKNDGIHVFFRVRTWTLWWYSLKPGYFWWSWRPYTRLGPRAGAERCRAPLRPIGFFFLQHFLRFCVCNIADSPKCLQHRLLQHLFSRQKVCNTVLCNMSKKREISYNSFLQQKCCKNSFLQHLCRFWQCFEKQSNLERGQNCY